MLPDARFASLLFASLRSALVAIDAEGHIAVLNAEARRILGLERAGSEAGFVGRACREVLEAQPTFVDLLCSALDGRDRPSRAELVLEPSREGESRSIGFTLACVRDGPAVRGAAMLFRDLAPIERMDEQERLRDRLAALGEMAAGLAHEIRNPLASMEVLAGLIDRQLGDRPELRELLAELRGELHGLADTVTHSLDFVKPSAPARDRVDPVALLEECLAQARARVDFAGEVERRYAPAIPRLAADGEQLRIVLSNLVVNALQAMAAELPAGEGRLRLEIAVQAVDAASGRLRVSRRGVESSSPAARELVIRVADNGPGISPQQRERIFYPFYTTKDSGSGVGLALAQKLVASHGGDLALESRPERGATFRVRLPLEEVRP